MKCLYHPKKFARFLCLTCKGLQFCRQCAITLHGEHDVQRITTKEPEICQRQDANDAVAKANQCSEDLHNLKREMEDFIQKEIQAINDRARDIMKFTASLAEQMTKRLQHVKEEKFKIIDDWDRQILTCSKKFQSVRRCSRKEDHIDMQCIREYFSYRNYFDSILHNISGLQDYKSEIPVLLPEKNFQEDLERIFGDLYCRDSNVSLDSDVGSMSVLTDKGYISNDSAISDSISFLHANDIVIRTLCPLNNDHCWVVKETDHNVRNDIEMIDRKGRLKEAVSLSSEVLDLTFSAGDTFVACSDKSIRRIYSNGSQITLFKTKSRPESLCKLKNKSLVVCFYKKGLIEKFDNNGHHITCLERDGDLIVTHPFRVRSNSSQTRVVMLNADPYSVVVMADDLSVKFFFDGSQTYYPGQLHFVRKKPESLLASQEAQILHFAPNDACFDREDNVLVNDCASMSCRILDPKGIPLRSMRLSQNLYPSALSLSPKNDLWVGFNRGNITVQKYNSDNQNATSHS